MTLFLVRAKTCHLMLSLTALVKTWDLSLNYNRCIRLACQPTSLQYCSLILNQHQSPTTSHSQTNIAVWMSSDVICACSLRSIPGPDDVIARGIQQHFELDSNAIWRHWWRSTHRLSVIDRADDDRASCWKLELSPAISWRLVVRTEIRNLRVGPMQN